MVFHQIDANGIANSEDPDQTAWALFVQTYLSENLGSLLYMNVNHSLAAALQYGFILLVSEYKSPHIEA